MYRVTDGYNLDANDKTYFDKFNIMEMLSGSRSLTSGQGFGLSTSLSTEKGKSLSAMRIVKKMAD